MNRYWLCEVGRFVFGWGILYFFYFFCISTVNLSLQVCWLVLVHQTCSPAHLTLSLPCCFCSPLGQCWWRVLSCSPEHIRSQLVQGKRAESGVWSSAQHGSPGENPSVFKFAHIADVYVSIYLLVFKKKKKKIICEPNVFKIHLRTLTNRSIAMFCALSQYFTDPKLGSRQTNPCIGIFNVALCPLHWSQGKYSEHEHHGLGLRQNGAAGRLPWTHNSGRSTHARWVITYLHFCLFACFNQLPPLLLFEKWMRTKI